MLSIKQIAELQARAEREASERLDAVKRAWPHCEGARCDFSPEPPEAPNYGQITRDTLNAQVDIMPKRLYAEQAYRPGFNEVELQSLRELLLGTAPGVREVKGVDYESKPAGWYDTNGNLVNEHRDWKPPYQANQGWGNASRGLGVPGSQVSWYEERKIPIELSRRIETPGTPGLIEMYEKHLIPTANRLQREATTQQREADLADVERLGGRYREAFRDMNPEQTALRDELYRKGMEDLKGDGLSMFERGRFQQAYRAANQGRLGDTGQSGAGAEAFYMADREREREVDNRNFAQMLIALDQGLYGDPVAQAVGRSSGISPLSTSLFGQGAGISGLAGPRLTNPSDPNAFQSRYVGYQGGLQADIAGAKNNADVYGGMIQSGVSGLAGGLAGMI